jgi:hypothetical protein
MPDDPIAILELRRRWLPTLREPIGEQLVGGRLVRPHGDRRDRA